MNYTCLLFFLAVLNFGSAQIVFLETFDETDDAVTGIDNTAGAVVWTTACPGSVAVDDYFKVLSGKLEGKDTNSPGATWETGDIDITACTGILISFDLEEVGDMEECIDCGGTGTSCIDWVKLAYNLDGAGWTDVAGTTCPLAESPGEMIQIGDILGGGPITYSSPCIDFGTTLAIRISCMCWAATEIWRFDNISVSCYDCVLPIELGSFTLIEHDQNVAVNWTTLSENSLDFFQLERSYNGIDYDPIATIKGAVNSESTLNYSYADRTVKYNGVVYYRLRQIDLDGKATLSATSTIALSPPSGIHYQDGRLSLSTPVVEEQTFLLYIYALNGQLIETVQIQNNQSIAWQQTGIFILKIPELNLQEKLVVY